MKKKYLLTATLFLAPLSAQATVVYLADTAVASEGNEAQPFSNTITGDYDDGVNTYTIISGTTTLTDALTYRNFPRKNTGSAGRTNGRFLNNFGSVSYTFTQAKDLSGMLLWNYNEYWVVSGTGKTYNERGITQANITVTYSGGTFTLNSQSFNLTPDSDLDTQLDELNQVDFGQDLTGVTQITLSNLQGGNGQFRGWHSVAFIAVPEPSSTALLGLGSLALFLRRRR